MDLSEIGCEVVDWMHMAQDKDQWWTLVHMMIKRQVP